ncbi:PcfJ domain-containing protein [Anaerocolumna aminovalerica]|uniref:PcfJ domain-containing protein n=1 Tax=Anaerocolumna aminovalerica TaxID=1527 RepID=UPI001C0EC255|nr:PcfJ domain-containing protein [Anaerocolumna aminovalerica]MBU5331437.1 PcfJ domain-containing protein [Anaerocolumna aminovalerica]
MKKKTLEKIQLDTLKVKKAYKKKWLVTARVVSVAEEEILLVNIFENSKGEKLPQFRLFLTKKEDAIQDLSKNEWRTQKIETLPGVFWGVDNYYEVLDKESEKAIYSFTNDHYSSGPMYRIQRTQEDFRSEKSLRRWNLRCERIENQMKIVDNIPLPKDLDNFIDESFSNQRYIFYKTEKGGRYVNMSCPHCGMKKRLDSKQEKKPRHNETGICHSCGSRIIYKSSGYKGDIRDIKEIIYMQKNENGFVSRYFDTYRNSGTDYENYEYYEKARVIYNGKCTKTYYRTNSYHGTPSWWDSNGGAYGSHVEYGKGILYYSNLDEVLKDTPFQYSALKLLAEHEKGYFINHESFLRYFEKRRFIEYLIKMRLFNLANDYVSHPYNSAINEEGKSVQEILNLPKQQINRLIEMDGDLYSLKLLQLEEKEGIRITNEQIKYITENNLRLENLKFIIGYTTLGKALKYLKINKGNDNMLSDWIDYIRNGKILDFNLTDEFVIFPRHFKQAHDNTTKLVLDMKNENQDKVFKKIMDEAIANYAFSTKTFEIVIPKKTSEITMEGQRLHHCVGTYIDRVIKQETLILFIRRKEDLSEPFYTMEVRQGRIVQVRGMNNKDMTPQVKQFVDSFNKKILNKEQMREAV